jgi:hypothetical protein
MNLQITYISEMSARETVNLFFVLSVAEFLSTVASASELAQSPPAAQDSSAVTRAHERGADVHNAAITWSIAMESVARSTLQRRPDERQPIVDPT